MTRIDNLPEWAFDGLDMDQVRRWPPDKINELMQLLARKRELRGLPQTARPWPKNQTAYQVLGELFPGYVYSPFAPHHEEFWAMIRDVTPGVKAAPILWIVHRRAGKTTSAQLAAAVLGAFRRRSYGMYIRGTQDGANSAVEAVGEMMTTPVMQQRFPEMSRLRPETLRTGMRQAAFSQTRIRTEGFLLDAVGLDKNIRGIKVGAARPDYAVIDDVDEEDDSPLIVQRKLHRLSRALFHAGTEDMLIVFISNVPHPNAIAARFAWPDKFPEDERMLLHARIVAGGPIPALIDPEYQQVPNPDRPGHFKWKIIAGTPTWPEGLGVAACEEELNRSNLWSFRMEFQHEEGEPDGKVFSHIDFESMRVHWDKLPRRFRDVQVWVDPATSDADNADAMGIVAAALDDDGDVWVLWAWEKRGSPTEALELAWKKAHELGASTLGIETDNGGDAWGSVAREALENLRKRGEVPKKWRCRLNTKVKASHSGKSKTERLKQLLEPLEHGRIRLMHGQSAIVVEGALRRFPRKPLDCADAFWHAYTQLNLRKTHQRAGVRSAASRRRPRPEFVPKERV